MHNVWSHLGGVLLSSCSIFVFHLQIVKFILAVMAIVVHKFCYVVGETLQDKFHKWEISLKETATVVYQAVK